MLVGREAESDRMADALRGVREGRGATLLLTGAPGVGKTALLDRAETQAGPLTVLRATGTEFESRLPWACLHQLLGPVLDLIPGLPAEQAAALRGALRLGPATGDDPFLVSQALLTLLSHTEPGAVCLVDDAQWIDGQSAQALRFVARRLARDPIGVVVAARDQPANPFVRDSWPTVEVRGLAPAAMAHLLQRRVTGAIAGNVRERLLTYADGNALALLESVAALSAHELAGVVPLPDPLPLSAGVESAFLDQVHRMPDDAQLLMLVAACADGASWACVLDAAGRLGVAASAAATIQRSGLVTVTAHGVRFRHPLVRAATVSGASFARRREVHLALAASMVDDGDSDRRNWHRAAACLGADAEVADGLEATAHLARGRSGFVAAAAALERAAELSPDPADRSRRLVLAADAAFQAGQPQRAMADAVLAAHGAAADAASQAKIAAVQGRLQLRAGLLAEAIRTLCDGADLVAGADPVLALEMLSSAGEAAGYAGDVPAMLDIAGRARIVDAAPPDAEVLRIWLTGTAEILTGDVERGSGAIRGALADDASATNAYRLLWAAYAALYLGDVAHMSRVFEASARAARACGDLGDLPLALHGMSVAATLSGRFREAESAADEGLRLAVETEQQAAQCLNLAALAAVASLRGDAERCRHFAERAVGLGVPRRFGLAVARATWSLAVLDLGAGRPEAALARLRPGVGHFLIDMYAAPDLVESAVRCGDLEAAHAAIAGLEVVVAHSGTPSSGALLARCRGLIAAPADAVVAFREALRLYGLGDEHFERSRTALLLGEALRRTKRRTEAREALLAALAAFDGLGAADWAARARRELTALGEPPASVDRHALAALTPQEMQIATLVSQGATNREIAAHLFLSARTVEYHLYKAYPKVGVSSRTELARLLLTTGRS